MINNSKFHKVGTKHKSYLERFEKKYSNIDTFDVMKIDSHSINIESNGEKIDHFTSTATLNQFLLVLMSFEMITAKASNYKVNFTNFNLKKISNAIFNYSNNTAITRYRNTRKIALLGALNIINTKNIDSFNISKKKGPLTMNDIKAEISTWEKEVMNTPNELARVIEELKNEYKI